MELVLLIVIVTILVVALVVGLVVGNRRSGDTATRERPAPPTGEDRTDVLDQDTQVLETPEAPPAEAEAPPAPPPVPPPPWRPPQGTPGAVAAGP